MFDIFRKIWRTGTVTRRQPLTVPALKYRGRLELDSARCSACSACRQVCPAGALRGLDGQPPVIDHGRCVFCGACAEACRPQALRVTNDCCRPVRSRQQLVEDGELYAKK